VKSTSYIVNPSFEYKSATEINDGSTHRGTPYGWKDTGGMKGNSFGINNDAGNLAGNNICWYYSLPMPDQFELYQDIENIPAGRYVVKCRLVVETANYLTTQRLFANNNVQYFGKAEDYDKNLTPGENNTFADWSPNGSLFLKEMQVEVVVQRNETLRLGIRTSNQYKDGTRERSNNAGWFKVDHFRLELKELFPVGIEMPEKVSKYSIESVEGGFYVNTSDADASGKMDIYSIEGVQYSTRKLSSEKTFVSMPRGIYLVNITAKNGESKTTKVLVR